MYFASTRNKAANDAILLLYIVTACLNLGVVTGMPSSNPKDVPSNWQPPSVYTFTSIQNTLSLFSIAYDTQQLFLLSEVFTPSATTNFTGKEVQMGLPAIITFLQSTLLPGGSQHASSTLHVNQTGADAATVVSYLQATFFGSGPTQGLVYQNYGAYEDNMVRQESGKWLVQSRMIRNFVSFCSGRWGGRLVNFEAYVSEGGSRKYKCSQYMGLTIATVCWTRST